MLNDLGYNADKVDGLWGNQSKKALKEFLDKKNLNHDGILNRKLNNFLSEEKKLWKQPKSTEYYPMAYMH